MSKNITRVCPACNTMQSFRSDNKTCGCRVSREEQETIEINGNECNISLPKTNIHTLEELLTYCKVDQELWQVDHFIVNKWEMGSKPLYQVKAFLIKKEFVADARTEIEALKRNAKKHAPLPYKIKKSTKTTGYMLEIDITDHHFGKLAWGVETGGANYDTKIATRVFWRAFDNILSRTEGFKFDEIWFVVGNDLFHTDNMAGTTTRGTQLSTDVRFQKTFAVVRNVMIQAIQRLRSISGQVKVIIVPGNHDQLTTWHLGDSLECYFHQYDDVVVDNNPRYYKMHTFGKAMILFTHGDKGKQNDYPLLMATEWPEVFGKTKFREVHTGHTHTTKVVEKHGVRVRVLSALCPPDSWHAENGFVGNLRSSEAFIWHKENGLIGTVIYTDSDDNIEKPSESKQNVV